MDDLLHVYFPRLCFDGWVLCYNCLTLLFLCVFSSSCFIFLLQLEALPIYNSKLACLRCVPLKAGGLFRVHLTHHQWQFWPAAGLMAVEASVHICSVNSFIISISLWRSISFTSRTHCLIITVLHKSFSLPGPSPDVFPIPSLLVPVGFLALWRVCV